MIACNRNMCRCLVLRTKQDGAADVESSFTTDSDVRAKLARRKYAQLLKMAIESLNCSLVFSDLEFKQPTAIAEETSMTKLLGKPDTSVSDKFAAANGKAMTDAAKKIDPMIARQEIEKALVQMKTEHNSSVNDRIQKKLIHDSKVTCKTIETYYMRARCFYLLNDYDRAKADMAFVIQFGAQLDTPEKTKYCKEPKYVALSRICTTGISNINKTLFELERKMWGGWAGKKIYKGL